MFNSVENNGIKRKKIPQTSPLTWIIQQVAVPRIAQSSACLRDFFTLGGIVTPNNGCAFPHWGIGARNYRGYGRGVFLCVPWWRGAFPCWGIGVGNYRFGGRGVCYCVVFEKMTPADLRRVRACSMEPGGMPTPRTASSSRWALKPRLTASIRVKKTQ